jgi:hypothetical protein
MPSPALARFKRFHAISYERQHDLSDAFIERRLKVTFILRALDCLRVRAERSFRGILHAWFIGSARLRL